MRKPLKTIMWVALLVGALPAAAAPPQTVPLDGVAYDVGKSLADNLRGLQGKRITVRLQGGSQVSGRVKAVGDALLHLEALDQKEFFDGLIPVSAIVGVETRFRQYAR